MLYISFDTDDFLLQAGHRFHLGGEVYVNSGQFYHLVVLQFCLEVAHVDDHYFLVSCMIPETGYNICHILSKFCPAVIIVSTNSILLS